jgi:hypothetical protein
MNQNIDVIVTMNADQHLPANVKIVALSAAERFTKSLKPMLICWAIAIACILVPVFHFVLVPGFLLFGLLQFYLHFKKTEFLNSGDVTCPHCQKIFAPEHSSFNWPKHEQCPNCQAGLILRKI